PWVPSQEYQGKTAIGAYGDFVHQTDSALGEILAKLDALDLAKDTMIIFTSDNGSHWPQRMIEETGHKANADWRGQKADIHEAGHRVPFLVRWPGQVEAGAVSDQLICLTDLMATAAAVVGHPLGKREGEDSYNLLPILKGTTKKSVRKAIVHHSLGGMFAIRIDNWKLVLGQGSGGFTKIDVGDGEPEGQLYNLKTDPGETKNRYEEKPVVVRKLRETLERYQRDGFSRLPGDTEDLLERLRKDQFKRIHQEIFRVILKGQPRVALEAMDRLPSELSQDGESHYMRAVAHSILGELDHAVADVVQATEAGVPISRFIGGTLTGLDALQAHPVFQQLRQNVSPIVHGPMLGQVTGSGAHVWVRTAEATTVRVAASLKADDFSQAILSKTAATTAETDFTAEIPVEGLAPRTTYHYRVLVGNEEASQSQATYELRTQVEAQTPTKFRLAFGGGAGYVPENERAFDTIRETNPAILLLLGDNVYSDAPESPAMQHYCYYRRQSRPEFSRLVAKTPVFSIWDDHDFGVNDCAEGPSMDVPAWKRPVYNVFRNNWVNPGYGGGDAQPGCYYDFYIGDVHFIMLDGRFYRNLDPGVGEVSMLGSVQREWLLKTLSKSKGTFKVLCSPVPWVFEAKGDSKDTWNGFKDERKIIFDFLRENKVTGSLFM
ncbi:MAG: sulfatase-like hydrolase/transferase, partial [Verrucomicrobiales bacterium]